MRKQTKHNLTAIIKDKRGNILSIGKNSYLKTHPLMYRLNKEKGIHQPHKIFLHAEIDAIVKCNNLEKAYSIEVYRVSKNVYRLSKPCPLCFSAILKTNIKVVKYIDENGVLVTEKI